MKTLAFLLAVVVVVALFEPKDDTDPPSGRSGLTLYTDNKTGCQYVKAGGFFGGAATPRLDTDGRQICGVSK